MPVTIFQFFHWYYPGHGQLWKDVPTQAVHLKYIGVSHVWLPPAYKTSAGGYGVGYDVYDLFDLGEFDQQNTIPTKYGTKDEYIAAIQSLHDNGMAVMADIVLNHKNGADETEKVKVVRVDVNDRTKYVDEPEEKDVHTKFYFPARNKKYSEFVWDFHAFSGVDDCTNENGKCIYKILNEYGDDWEELVGNEMGNYDYLMGADIEFRNPNVRAELKYWGKWYVETTGVDSFRLDAVKHISPDFYKEWLDHINGTFQKQFLTVGEYWNQDISNLKKYLDVMEGRVQLFDVPLHYHFYEASKQGKDYNLSSIFDNTLVKESPQLAITFVDNHDTQPGQALESFVEYWFKPHAYALILLRPNGIPSVFHTDYFGADYSVYNGEEEHPVQLTPARHLYKMLRIRACILDGEFEDHMDHPNVIGWCYKAVEDRPESGFAVVLSNNEDGFKEMSLGSNAGNTEFSDITGNVQDVITTNNNGLAIFPVKERNISIWVRKQAEELLK